MIIVELLIESIVVEHHFFLLTNLRKQWGNACAPNSLGHGAQGRMSSGAKCPRTGLYPCLKASIWVSPRSSARSEEPGRNKRSLFLSYPPYPLEVWRTRAAAAGAPCPLGARGRGPTAAGPLWPWSLSLRSPWAGWRRGPPVWFETTGSYPGGPRLWQMGVGSPTSSSPSPGICTGDPWRNSITLSSRRWVCLEGFFFYVGQSR